VANTNDNTALNPGVGGDNISTEDQPAGTQRGDAALPLVDYKMPRSKIAIGPYDLDLGDAGQYLPLPVQTLRERGIMEEQMISARRLALSTLSTRSSYERTTSLDSRFNYSSRGYSR
jgi:hypothetical protein